MTTNLTLWALIVAVGNGASAPVVIDRFYFEKDCMAALIRIESNSRKRSNFPYLGGFCILEEGVVR